MGNHYHLLLETFEANLSGGMRRLNGRYTQECNRRHHTGWASVARPICKHSRRKGGYLLELCWYIVLHPVRSCCGGAVQMNR